VKVLARRMESGPDGSLGFAHEVQIEGGHRLLVDEPATLGGTDSGPPPSRLVAAGLAGCTAVTIEMYAERKGWNLGAVEVEVDVAYEKATPTSFDVTLRLPEHLTDSQKERLLGIAAKCPVHRVLSRETQVAISDRIETL
jgi:putative redox protein